MAVQSKSRSKRENVMSYSHLIEAVSEDTGLKKSQVRKIFESTQRKSAEFLKAAPGNRVHFGRLCTFFSKMTSDRMVNHPQKPGEKIKSPAHLVVRIDVGSHLAGYLAGQTNDWDEGAEPIPADEDAAPATAA